MVDLFAWVQTVTPDMLPSGPILLGPCVTVMDPARWLTAVQLSARNGTASPRARYGALQHDLRDLYYELVNTG